jgi:hypothetical protein
MPGDAMLGSQSEEWSNILPGIVPSGCILRRHKSTTHVVHCEQQLMTEPYYLKMQKQVTHAMAMGRARQPDQPPLTETKPVQSSQSFACQEGQLLQKAGGACVLDVETFKSKVPLKWPVGGTNSTAYTVRCHKDFSFP